MTKNELKELVKQHFNLVEANVEKFDKAELEDGSKVSNRNLANLLSVKLYL